MKICRLRQLLLMSYKFCNDETVVQQLLLTAAGSLLVQTDCLLKPAAELISLSVNRHYPSSSSHTHKHSVCSGCQHPFSVAETRDRYTDVL